MRYLLLFIVIPVWGQVTPEDYGAVGNGTTNDAAAIQSAFDTGSDVVFDGAKTYRIDSQIDIDVSGDQSVEGNGATILAGVEISKMFHVDKSSGIFSVDDLDVDADLKGEWVWHLESSYSFTDCDVVDVYSDDGTAIAFFQQVTESGNWTVARMDGCTVDYVRSENNDIIGDTEGTSRALLIQYTTTPSDLDSWFQNCDFSRALGEDGDVAVVQTYDFDFSTSSTITFNNCTFDKGTRRVLKLFAGGIYIFNSTLTGIDTSDPDYIYAKETGGFVSMSNNSTNSTIPATNIVFDKCVFNGSSFDERIIQSHATDIVINECNWNNGTDFRMWRNGGGVCITNNVVTAGSRIYEVNDDPPFNWYGPMNVSGNFGTPVDFDQYSDASPPTTPYDCVEYTNPNDIVAGQAIKKKKSAIIPIY